MPQLFKLTPVKMDHSAISYCAPKSQLVDLLLQYLDYKYLVSNLIRCPILMIWAIDDHMMMYLMMPLDGNLGSTGNLHRYIIQQYSPWFILNDQKCFPKNVSLWFDWMKIWDEWKIVRVSSKGPNYIRVLWKVFKVVMIQCNWKIFW